MIKNVIFDLGRVMLRYEPLEYLHELGYNEEKIRDLMESVFDSTIWVEIDRGTYGFTQAIDMFCEKAPELANDVRDILQPDIFFPRLTIMQDSLDFYWELKNAGYSIYILSNFSAEGIMHVRARYDFFQAADGIVISSDVRMVKPEFDIFYHIRDTYGLNPAETVFIDDSKANIDTAREIGFQTILFTDMARCRTDFDKLSSIR